MVVVVVVVDVEANPCEEIAKSHVQPSKHGQGTTGTPQGTFVSLSDVDSLRGQKPPEIDGTRCSTVATNPSSSSLAVNQSDN